MYIDIDPDAGPLCAIKLTQEEMQWVIDGLSAWRSDYEGAHDEPWERIEQLKDGCQRVLNIRRATYQREDR